MYNTLLVATFVFIIGMVFIIALAAFINRKKKEIDEWKN